MAAVAKVNPELPGVERPTNESLEEVCAQFLEARDDKKRARDDEKAARAAATERMREVADKLEVDAHGNPTYVYRDGTRAVALKLSTSTKLTVEVLDDGSGDDEDLG